MSYLYPDSRENTPVYIPSIVVITRDDRGAHSSEYEIKFKMVCGQSIYWEYLSRHMRDAEYERIRKEYAEATI
ncbi:MAG TPA: hypothetical protein VIM64_11580 [Puia sp.]